MPKTYKKSKRGGLPIKRTNRSRASRASSSLPRPSYRTSSYYRPPYQNSDPDAMDVVEDEYTMPGDLIEDEEVDEYTMPGDLMEDEDDIPRVNLEQDCQTEERSPGVFESGISYETLIPSQTVKLSDGRCYSFQDVVNLYDRAGSQANFKSPFDRRPFTNADYDIVMELMSRGIQPDQPYSQTIVGGSKKKKKSSKKKKKSSKKKKKTSKKRKTTKRKRS